MNCRTVLICLLIAQAACTPVRNGSLNKTITMIREEIGKALKELVSFLNESGLLPNNSCNSSLNTTKLLGPEQQPLTVNQLFCFRCCMMEMSKLTTEVSDQLLNASQFTQDMELQIGGMTSLQNCSCTDSLRTLKDEIDGYVLVRCLLESLDQRYSNAKF